MLLSCPTRDPTKVQSVVLLVLIEARMKHKDPGEKPKCLWSSGGRLERTQGRKAVRKNPVFSHELYWGQIRCHQECGKIHCLAGEQGSVSDSMKKPRHPQGHRPEELTIQEQGKKS